jgi:hypothetical protein
VSCGGREPQRGETNEIGDLNVAQHCCFESIKKSTGLLVRLPNIIHVHWKRKLPCKADSCFSASPLLPHEESTYDVGLAFPPPFPLGSA